MRSLWCLVLILPAWGSARAELVCERPVADLGTVKAGAPLGHQFTFTNKGTATIELTGFKTSCACFRPELPKRVLLPGESATIDLQGNTLAQEAGPQSWRIRLGYHEGNEDRELIFEVRATIVVEVAVQPPTLSLNTDSTLAHELIVRDLREKPLALTGAQTTSPGLRATFDEAKPFLKGGWARRVVVEVGADYPVGRRDELLVLQSRDPDYPELRIPITVTKRPKSAVHFSPAEVVIVGTRGEPLPSRLVQVGSAGSPAEIDRVEPLHSALTCSWAAGTMRVRADAAQVPATGLESTVRVFLKGANPGPIVVPVRVEWRTQ
jgi:hypothetical protein